MNKQNKILLGILALIVACTIGYALFSEAITINGTATASGDFEITTTCGIATYEQMAESGFTDGTGELKQLVKTATASCTGNTVVLNTELSAPGGFVIYYVRMENTGTIPYQFDEENPIEPIAGAESHVSGDITIYSADGMISMTGQGVLLNGHVIEEPPVIVQPGEEATFFIEARWTSTDTTNSAEARTILGSYHINLEQIH